MYQSVFPIFSSSTRKIASHFQFSVVQQLPSFFNGCSCFFFSLMIQFVRLTPIFPCFRFILELIRHILPSFIGMNHEKTEFYDVSTMIKSPGSIHIHRAMRFAFRTCSCILICIRTGICSCTFICIISQPDLSECLPVIRGQTIPYTWPKHPASSLLSSPSFSLSYEFANKLLSAMLSSCVFLFQFSSWLPISRYSKSSPNS